MTSKAVDPSVAKPAGIAQQYLVHWLCEFRLFVRRGSPLGLLDTDVDLNTGVGTHDECQLLFGTVIFSF